MKPNDRWPAYVLMSAHLLYPVECGKASLYGAAFFGHGIPAAAGKRTPESVWRGLCRRELRKASGAK